MTVAQLVGILAGLLAVVGREVFDAALRRHGYRRVEQVRPAEAYSLRAMHEILGTHASALDAELAALEAPAASTPVEAPTPPAVVEAPTPETAAAELGLPPALDPATPPVAASPEKAPKRSRK